MIFEDIKNRASCKIKKQRLLRRFRPSKESIDATCHFESSEAIPFFISPERFGFCMLAGMIKFGGVIV